MAKRSRAKRQKQTPAANYYEWQTATVNIDGHAMPVCMKPGMAYDATDVAAQLLAAHIQIAPTDVVLDLNCGAGLVGATAALMASAGRVLLADANILAVESARRTVAANALTNAAVYASSGLSHMADASTVGALTADVVTMRLPKGKRVALQLMRDAFHALKPGGSFYLAGANDEGIKTMLRHAEALFGAMTIPAYRKGHRVGTAIKPAEPPPRPAAFADPWLDANRYAQFPFATRGKTYTIVSRPGIFSWNRLDAGTAMLLDAINIAPTDNVLDLGCGNGIVGVVAAQMAAAGAVHLCDANIVAVEAARRTVDCHQLPNCHVHLSDCAAAVGEMKFDVVLTNPPFHQGKGTQYDAARQFMQDAARVLKRGGRFYLVANRFIGYEEQVQALFGNVEIVAEDARFKVLLARK